MADTRHQPVVVIGLGRFGSAVALELVNLGTEVLAIDSGAKQVQDLSGKLDHVVVADSTDIDALRQLDVQEFPRAVVGIGTDIEASILTTSLLVEMGVGEIWAKAVSVQHGQILRRIGAHHVVFPEHDMGERVAHVVSGSLLDYVEVEEDFAMVKTKPPRSAVGVPLGQTRLRSDFGITIVAVKPAAKVPSAPSAFTYATVDTVLGADDVILVVGTVSSIEAFVNVD